MNCSARVGYSGLECSPHSLIIHPQRITKYQKRGDVLILSGFTKHAKWHPHLTPTLWTVHCLVLESHMLKTCLGITMLNDSVKTGEPRIQAESETSGWPSGMFYHYSFSVVGNPNFS